MTPPPGSPVHVVMTKWGDRPHWEYTGTVLGEDEHGTWLGYPRGLLVARPGYSFVTEVESVALVPREGWFLARFHAPGIWCDRYVDISTPPVWDGATLRAVDLDLDVIRMAPEPPPGGEDNQRPPWGTVYVDDEDEFAEHRIAFGYPDDVVAAAEASRDAVLADMQAQVPPFDATTTERWLAAVSGRA